MAGPDPGGVLGALADDDDRIGPEVVAQAEADLQPVLADPFETHLAVAGGQGDLDGLAVTGPPVAVGLHVRRTAALAFACGEGADQGLAAVHLHDEAVGLVADGDIDLDSKHCLLGAVEQQHGAGLALLAHVEKGLEPLRVAHRAGGGIDHEARDGGLGEAVAGHAGHGAVGQRRGRRVAAAGHLHAAQGGAVPGDVRRPVRERPVAAVEILPVEIALDEPEGARRAAGHGRGPDPVVEMHALGVVGVGALGTVLVDDAVLAQEEGLGPAPMGRADEVVEIDGQLVAPVGVDLHDVHPGRFHMGSCLSRSRVMRELLMGWFQGSAARRNLAISSCQATCRSAAFGSRTSSFQNSQQSRLGEPPPAGRGVAQLHPDPLARLGIGPEVEAVGAGTAVLLEEEGVGPAPCGGAVGLDRAVDHAVGVVEAEHDLDLALLAEGEDPVDLVADPLVVEARPEETQSPIGGVLDLEPPGVHAQTDEVAAGIREPVHVARELGEAIRRIGRAQAGDGEQVEAERLVGGAVGELEGVGPFPARPQEAAEGGVPADELARCRLNRAPSGRGP